MGLLLLEHRAKERSTKADVPSSISGVHQDHLPEAFGRAAACLQLVFGVDVKGVEPSDHACVRGTTWASSATRW